MSVTPSKSASYTIVCPKCKSELSYGPAAHCPECNTTFLPDGPHPTVEERDHKHMGHGTMAVQPVKVLHPDGTRTSMTMSWEL